MKFSITIAWVFPLTLWLSSASADISLTLRNQQYLPLPIQELPINEDYFNAYQKSKESNYGSSRYQIFEVHNHYRVSGGEGGNEIKSLDKEINFANSNYKRTNSADKIRLEHINTPTDVSLDDPSLDVSYLSFANGNDDSQQQIIMQRDLKHNIPVPFPSNFHHTFPEKSQNAGAHSFTSVQQYPRRRYDEPTFKGPDYLPPKSQSHPYLTQPEQRSLPAQDHQAHQQQGSSNAIENSHQIIINNKDTFKASDYFQLLQQNSVLAQQAPEHLSSHEQEEGFKGRDYSPPQQHFSSQARENLVHTVPFRGSNYAHYYQPTSNLQQLDQHFRTKSHFKGPDYLPPLASFKAPEYSTLHQTDTEPQQQQQQPQDKQFRPSEQYSLENSFKAPDYLPPHQSQTEGPSKNSDVVQSQHETKHSNNHFKAPDYLPPHQSQIKPPLKGSDNLQYQDFHNPFKGPDYLPPHQSQIKTPLKGSDNYQSQHFQNAFKGPDYLPPQQTHIKASTKGSENLQPQYETKFLNNTFKGPEYLPPHSSEIKAPLKGFDNYQSQHFQNAFKGPDYLPPQQSEIKASTKGSESLQSQYETKFLNNPFKGPEYLPPHLSQIKAPLAGLAKAQPQHETKLSTNAFKGPDYLPPNPSKLKSSFKGPDNFQTQHLNDPFKGPDYLPPVGNKVQPQPDQVQDLPEGYDFKKPPNAQQAIEELHKLPEETPVLQLKTAQRDETSSKNYDPAIQAGDLPAGYDFNKPANSEQAIKLLHSQEASTTSSSQSITGAQSSLPVYHFQKGSTSGNIETPLQNLNSSVSITNGFVRASEQVINKIIGQQIAYNKQQLQLNSQTNQREASLQPTLVPTKQLTQQLPTKVALQPLQNFKGPAYLPPTLGSATFRGADYLPPSSDHLTSKGGLSFTPSTPSFKAPEYLPPNSGTQNNKSFDFWTPIDSPRETVPPLSQQNTKVFKGPDYLPPTNQQSSYQSTPNKQFKGTDYLPPTNTQASYQATPHNQFKGADYLPPTEHKTVTMYPLSSYMTNITPNDRYGNRRAFAEYGLPPAKTITFLNSNDIAPLYRQPTPKPQYYAPAMSYTKNAFLGTTSALSAQTRQALQTFMPDDIRQKTSANNFRAAIPAAKATATLQAAKPAKAKLRTVQIVNPNAVRTLKVLESLDDTGVKTIKILGSSNELPSGEHRVVRVVSGRNEQSVQTVKIFNEQQDLATTAESTASAVAKGNRYLPPRTKRNPTSKSNAFS